MQATSGAGDGNGPFARDCLLNSLSPMEPRYYLPSRQDGAFFLLALFSRIIFTLLTFPAPHARSFLCIIHSSLFPDPRQLSKPTATSRRMCTLRIRVLHQHR